METSILYKVYKALYDSLENYKKMNGILSIILKYLISMNNFEWVLSMCNIFKKSVKLLLYNILFW